MRFVLMRLIGLGLRFRLLLRLWRRRLLGVEGRVDVVVLVLGLHRRRVPDCRPYLVLCGRPIVLSGRVLIVGVRVLIQVFGLVWIVLVRGSERTESVVLVALSVGLVRVIWRRRRLVCV